MAETAPFCSRRCRDVDLGRWFSGSYAVPGSPAEDQEEAASDPSADDDEG